MTVQPTKKNCSLIGGRGQTATMHRGGGPMSEKSFWLEEGCWKRAAGWLDLPQGWSPSGLSDELVALGDQVETTYSYFEKKCVLGDESHGFASDGAWIHPEYVFGDHLTVWLGRVRQSPTLTSDFEFLKNC